MNATIERELDEKAAREATWLALYMAQRCGWQAIVNQLTSVISQVDALRQTGEADRDV